MFAGSHSSMINYLRYGKPLTLQSHYNNSLIHAHDKSFTISVENLLTHHLFISAIITTINSLIALIFPLASKMTNLAPLVYSNLITILL